METGYLKGGNRAPAFIKVFEEAPNDQKGSVLQSETKIEIDEVLGPYNTERGRIIYDYKFNQNDSWIENVHAWCHRGETTIVP